MVQFYEPVTWKVAGPNEYWKLDSGARLSVQELVNLLKTSKFSCKSRHKGRARVCALYFRCQRGLLPYDGLPTSELKLFASQRALPSAQTFGGQKLTTTTLKALLEEADDDATFERLSDLPPELRTAIFAHYFNSLDDSLARRRYKYQPPITLVSPQIRQESLPLFYENSTFIMEGNQNLDRNCAAAALSATTRSFVASTTGHFARIRNLRINLRNRWGYDLRIDLDLTKKDNPVGDYNLFAHPPNPNVNPQKHQKVLDCLSELSAKSRAIAVRPMELRVSDIEELVMILCNRYHGEVTGSA
jgi:hypothetical protein